uniref:Interferon-induced GTP-binding protein Mx n=1 Tax=Neogobius melanostomus TaxID=47308 RepID=A0A8C6V0F6_9GOBI
HYTATSAQLATINMNNTLNQQYEEKVRPCIDLIDSLRSLGVEQDLALPAIAVIGDQSSGKSSVLEALSGVALPRGSGGYRDKMSLELKMKRRKDGEEWYGKIKYQDHEEEIEDSADVEKKIREAQDQIAGVGVDISEELISLEIASPNVPDLTLIDLPGITRVAVNGQREDIGERIKGLIWRIIKKQETISLVVVPCNVDIATTEALRMAQEVDPDGERTLGILTKPDLVDIGTEETVVDTVHNEVINLKKGFMIVRCRGQKEIKDKVSLPEAIEKEKAFFRDHAFFHTLFKEGFATVPKLAEKLTLELVRHIELSLPRLEEQIEEKIAKTQVELERYGSGPPSDAGERLIYLIDKVTAFTQDALGLTTGDELKCGDKMNVFSALRKDFAKWKHILDKSGDKCKEVEIYEDAYRGKELPGFINYKTFEAMVKEQIKQLEEPAVKRLKDAGDSIRKAYLQLAQICFTGFPNLLKMAKNNIESIRQEKETTAEGMLRTQFKMEMIVYTQDRTYSNSLSERKQEEDEEEERRPKHHKNRSIVYYMDNRATLTELMLHLKSYYQIASQRLADQIPMVIRYQMLQELAVDLQRQMLQMLQDKDNVEVLLKEDYDIGTKRAALQSRHKRLLKARAYLMGM